MRNRNCCDLQIYVIFSDVTETDSVDNNGYYSDITERDLMRITAVLSQ